MSEREKIQIEFIKVWGHPTKNEIYGPPTRVWCTPWQAIRLINSGYAKQVKNGTKNS